jgi:hypothetical protein
MKLHPLIQKTLSYIWRLIALAAIFIGGVIALFFAAAGLSDAGILSLGFIFSSGRDDDWVYPLMVIIPSLAVILLSWIFYRRDIKRTLVFWGITAIVSLIIAAPYFLDHVFGYLFIPAE